jgi:TPR repeat protein
MTREGIGLAIVLACVHGAAFSPAGSTRAAAWLHDSGLAADGAQTAEKARQPARLELEGLSVVPPAGRNWVRGDDGKNPGHVEFWLRGGGLSTYYVRAELRHVGDAPLRDAADIVAYLKEHLQEGPRQQNLRVTFAIEPAVGPACASFDLQAEDAGSPKLPGGVFELDARGLFCLHPTVPDVLVAVDYSRRTPRGRKHGAGRSAGDEFISSLKFTDIALTAPEEHSIAMRYRHGRGVRADDALAVYWFRRAAEQGYLPAWTELCWHFEHGRGLPREVEGAAQCYLRVAAQGDPRAQLLAGLMYTSGNGVSTDYRTASEWFRKAAEQGDPRAQAMLASHYRFGVGVAEDPAEAFKWLRRAAEGNHPYDQYGLSTMYSEGTGVPRDLVQAYKWCSLAATQPSERQQKYATACEALAAQMTAAEVAEALALASAWRKVCEER